MKSKTIIAFAIVASVLLVSAPMTSAASSDDQLVVGSQHDTQTEFSNAQELTNLSATSSGDGAVELLVTGISFSDSFEDEPADSGLPESWSTVYGSISSQSVTTSLAADGTQSYRLGSDDNYIAGHTLSSTTKQVSGSIYQESGGETFLQLRAGGSMMAKVGMIDGDLVSVNSSGVKTISTAPDQGEWISLTFRDIDPAADNMTVEWSTDSASGTTTVDFYRDLPSSGYETVAVQTASSAVSYFDAVRIGDQPVTAQYIGSHNVSGAEQATINITALSNVSVTATVRTAVGAVLNQTTLTTTGNHTLTLASTSASQIEVVLDISSTGNNSRFKLADESILFTNHAPNATAVGPSGDLQTAQPTLAVNVSDEEFGTAQGESVTIDWIVDGEVVGTTSASSAGPVSFELPSALEGGTHTWHARVNDSYGASTTTSTLSISAPASILIKSEVGDHKVLSNASLNVTARLYSGELIFNRNVDGGNINLTGLPSDRSYILSVTADNYYRRTIVIDSLYEQNSVFLLPTSEPAVYNEFVLSDLTGQFANNPDTTLYIDTAMNTSDTSGLEWRTISGDQIGADSRFKSYLAENDRYRLRISDGHGNVRVLGSYVATEDGVVPLTVGQVKISSESDRAYVVEAWQEDTSENATTRFVLEDPENQTSSVCLRVFERGNTSNLLYETTCYNATYGQLVVSMPMTASEANESWVVDYRLERGGEVVDKYIAVGTGGNIRVWGDSGWINIAGFFVLILTSFLYSDRIAMQGLVVVSGLAGVGILWGVLNIAWSSWIVAAMIAIGGYVARSADGGGY